MNLVDRPNEKSHTESLTIAGKTYRSRLLVGSGKYRDLEQTRLATEASGAEIITVAIRRVNIGQDPNAPNLLDVVPPSQYTILPNTAGCYNAKDAVYTLQLARELLNGHKLVKLEVLGDEKTLFPNMPETLKAAETLVKDGFDVMVYCSDDPIQAKMLQMTELALRCSNIVTRLQVRNCGASRHNHCRPYAEVIDVRSSSTITSSYAWNWMRTGYTWAARMHRSHKFVP